REAVVPIRIRGDQAGKETRPELLALGVGPTEQELAAEVAGSRPLRGIALGAFERLDRVVDPTEPHREPDVQPRALGRMRFGPLLERLQPLERVVVAPGPPSELRGFPLGLQPLCFALRLALRGPDRERFFVHLAAFETPQE